VPTVERDIDILFVGALSNHRNDILALAAQKYAVTHIRGAFHADCAALYSRAKVVLNIHFTPLANCECRVIEALGCEAFVLTERLDPANWLVDGQHLVTFDTKNLMQILDHYLQNGEERSQIARAGHAAIQDYTVERQVGHILDVVAELDTVPSVLAQTKSDQALTSRNPAETAPSRRSSKQCTVTINERRFTVLFPADQSIDYMLNEIFVNKVYPLLPYLSQSNRVILDVGANIGCATILFRALYPDAAILAFEPDRETFEYLQLNGRDLTNVRCFNCGLFDCEGKTRLFKGRGTSTTNSISISVHNSAEYEEVVLTRLSRIIAEQEIGHISILKLDTEGAEVPILSDIKDHLDQIEAIFLKYHSEVDRQEIDRILSNRFGLVSGHVSALHRGTLIYVAKDVIASRTDFDKRKIPRTRSITSINGIDPERRYCQ
jgi:FkbM family methyltransferase